MSLVTFENKICAPDKKMISRIKKQKGSVVFTNGCFDILHRGHVTYLAQTKALGDFLIVALNTNDSVKRQNKGDDRPINSLENRLAVIAALESVDLVTWFDEDTPFNLIEQIKPNILVKGGDWSIDKIVGAKETIERGGEVHSIPFLFDTSTTKTLAAIRQNQ